MFSKVFICNQNQQQQQKKNESSTQRDYNREILKHTKCKAGILKKEKARKWKKKKVPIQWRRKSGWNEKFNFKENKISKALYEETSQKSTSSTIKK